MEVKVEWNGGLLFTASGATGATIPLQSGHEAGFIPMELIAIGLAGCTSMDVISILEKKRQQVTTFEVKVHAERASEHPRVFTRARIQYLLTGHSIDPAAVLRAIELSATRYCPAQAMLSRVFPIDLEYHIYEAGQDGERRETHHGSYQVQAALP